MTTKAKGIRRTLDISYENYRSIPRWKQIAAETINQYLRENKVRSSKRAVYKIFPVGLMPDTKFRIEISPPQEFDPEEVAARIIEALRSQELEKLLSVERQELEAGYNKKREAWEKREIEARARWEEKWDRDFDEYEDRLTTEFDKHSKLRKSAENDLSKYKGLNIVALIFSTISLGLSIYILTVLF